MRYPIVQTGLPRDRLVLEQEQKITGQVNSLSDTSYYYILTDLSMLPLESHKIRVARLFRFKLPSTGVADVFYAPQSEH